MSAGNLSTGRPDTDCGLKRDISPASPTESSTTLVHKHDNVRLSTLRLLLAHFGAALTLFLATTDATIVSTTLPTIVNQMKATQTEYTWVGVSYMLTQTAFQPLYGRLSDLIGRKTVMYGSMLIFAAGSLLCGLAQDIYWLIVARALAGIGGGGIVSTVWTITAELVDVHSRAKWSQALSITWSCSAVAGPLLGGLFSEESGALSWRWAFYLNLPICVTAAIVLWISLRDVKLGCGQEVSWRRFGKMFDFLGLLLFMGGSSCIVIGFSFATDASWTSTPTLCLIVVGLVVLFCGGVYEVRTKREALFPPAVFKQCTIVIILVVNFLHNFAFTAGTFYLAIYFQAVDGLSPLRAGVSMLPYSLGASLSSMPTAWFIGFWQKKRSDTSGQKMMICVGLAIATLGFGLMILLNSHTASLLKSIYPLIAGVGLGMLFHAPYQIFTRGLRPEDMASGTSAFFLVRFTGATIGLSVAGAIFHSRLVHNLPAGIPPSVDVESIKSIQPTQVRLQVIGSMAASLQSIWIVCCICLGVALLSSLFLRTVPISDSSEAKKSATAFTPGSEPKTEVDVNV